MRKAVRAGLAVAATLATGALAAPARADAPLSDAYPTPQAIAANAEFLLQAPPPPPGAGVVCVIDSGVTPMHDLADGREITERIAVGGGTVDDSAMVPDDATSGHGTFVAAEIASRVDGWGSAGLWPHAKIVSVGVFASTGNGSAADYRAAIFACQQSSHRVDVVNLSLATPEGTGLEPDLLRDRIADTRERGINVVAAAGNTGGAPEQPARFEETFAIGATDMDAAFCSFSSRGIELDLSAPGCDPAISLPRGGVGRFSGTSFASPLVSASLAALRAYKPSLGAVEAEALLVSTARSTSAGRILDVAAAFRAAGLGEIVDAYVPVGAPAADRPPALTPTSDNRSALSEEPRPAIQSEDMVATAETPPLPGPPRSEAAGTAVLSLDPNSTVPAKPKLRRLQYRRGRLLVELNRLPEAGLARFTVDHKTYTRAVPKLSVRVRSWTRLRVVVENSWGDRSQPLRISRRHKT